MYLDKYITSKHVQENVFMTKEREVEALPTFEAVKNQLPQPIWENHQDVIECYWKTWEMAFGNLRQPSQESGFISNYIDTAFNHCVFMWDSCFMLQFGKYGTQSFDFIKTLDNFYAKQHTDGFICREISTIDGIDRFHRHDPISTGPNLLPWMEWEHYCHYNDKERLAEVFPVLVAYHEWLAIYRTWPNGTYWSSGWGCGMDNQLRVDHEEADKFHHGHLTWADACMQQILSAEILIKMGEVLGRDDAKGLEEEIAKLRAYINEHMWDEKQAFYFDVDRDEKHTDVKTIGAYWALLIDLLDDEKMARFVAHLEDENEFKRPHRIPTLAYSSKNYKDDGGYWKGGVWAPTNYMVLKGLEKNNYFDLAHEIALNHIANVVQVFKETETLWENYMPEGAGKGNPAKPNFVGWTGLTPITMLIEYVFGIRIDVPNNKIKWQVRLTEEHGVQKIPFGKDGYISLKAYTREAGQEPKVEVESNVEVEVEVCWENGSYTVQV